MPRWLRPTTASPLSILMVGNYGAGRTVLLHQIKCGEVAQTIPTIGFNVETVTLGATPVTFWDLRSCDKVRPLWRHYTKFADAYIFVADVRSTYTGSERYDFEESRDELLRILAEPGCERKPLLVFSNKQALPGRMSADALK